MYSHFLVFGKTSPIIAGHSLIILERVSSNAGASDELHFSIASKRGNIQILDHSSKGRFLKSELDIATNAPDT